MTGDSRQFHRAFQKYNKIYKEELPKITPHVARHTYCTNMVKWQIGAKKEVLRIKSS